LTCFIADSRPSGDGGGRTRVGIQVAGTVGCAVVRNRLRRRLKAILDQLLLADPPFRDIVFIARPGAGELSFEHLVDEVRRVYRTS
jgi:ribonuclease P protein component